MKSIFITLFALLIASSSYARPKFVEKNFVDTIQIKYENGSVYVPITIKGKAYDFLFDTVAGFSVLPDSLNGSLLIKELGDMKVKTSNDEKSDNLSRGILSEMTIGHLHLRGMQAVLTKSSSRFIFGFGNLYLKGISVKLDIKNKILILTDQKNFFRGEDGYKISLKLSSVSPDMPFRMSNGCKGLASFDTGNNSFMSISRDYYDKCLKGENGAKFKKQIVNSDPGADCREKISLKIDELKTGDVTFCDVPATVTPDYTGIGSRILEYGSIIINAKDVSMLFQPNDKKCHGVIQIITSE